MLQRCTVISVMNLVSELDLPEFDYSAADFSADRYHQQLAETRQRGWLAKSPLAYIVLDHDAGEFFLRSRKTAFPGRQIAEFFGVTSGPLAEHIDANILNLGGEQHRRLRALVGPALTPRGAGRGPAGRSGRRPDQRAAGGARGEGGRGGGWGAAVRRGVRPAGDEPASRRHRHHRGPARARDPPVRRAPRAMGAAGGRAG